MLKISHFLLDSIRYFRIKLIETDGKKVEIELFLNRLLMLSLVIFSTKVKQYNLKMFYKLNNSLSVIK